MKIGLHIIILICDLYKRQCYAEMVPYFNLEYSIKANVLLSGCIDYRIENVGAEMYGYQSYM